MSTGTRIVPDNDGAVDSVVVPVDKVEIPEYGTTAEGC